MEQQTQAMCSMFAMLRARARVSITTGRERTRLCHFNIRSRQGTASWGFPVVGKATGRKEASRKAAVHGLYPAKVVFPTQEPAFPRASTMTKVRLNSPLLNNWVVTTNVTTGTGKEGRKKGRKEGRKNEEGVCQPGFEPVMYDFTRMWITTEPIGTKTLMSDDTKETAVW